MVMPDCPLLQIISYSACNIIMLSIEEQLAAPKNTKFFFNENEIKLYQKGNNLRMGLYDPTVDASKRILEPRFGDRIPFSFLCSPLVFPVSL